MGKNKALALLQLCPKPPYPGKDGGSLAMDALRQSLEEQDVDLTILSAYSYKHSLGDLDKVYLEKTKFQAVFLDLRPRLIPAFLNLFTGKSYILARFYSRVFRKKLISILKQGDFDLIQIETLMMAPYIGIIRQFAPKAKIVLRSHNVEFQIWEQKSQKQRSFFKRIYFRFLARTLKKEEITYTSQVDGLLVITEQDGAVFKSLGIKTPNYNFPFGIRFDKQAMFLDLKKKQNLDLSLCFIGAMNWWPNVEGIEWFLEDIWPSLKAAYPQLSLSLAGRNMPSSFFEKHISGVSIQGEIEDMKSFIDEHSLFIVPLISGSGVRIKIIEAMALGTPIISTRFAARGILCEHKKDIYFADSPQEFLEALNYFKNNKGSLASMGAQARQTSFENQNVDKLGLGLMSFYNSLGL